jgi:hypothetical protein
MARPRFVLGDCNTLTMYGIHALSFGVSFRFVRCPWDEVALTLGRDAEPQG